MSAPDSARQVLSQTRAALRSGAARDVAYSEGFAGGEVFPDSKANLAAVGAGAFGLAFFVWGNDRLDLMVDFTDAGNNGFQVRFLTTDKNLNIENGLNTNDWYDVQIIHPGALALTPLVINGAGLGTGRYAFRLPQAVVGKYMRLVVEAITPAGTRAAVRIFRTQEG